ncbi:cupin domain-containing protein [Streptomyces xiamenensis]
MKQFRLDQLEAERTAHNGAYLRFLRERSMSAGLYALNVGDTDSQGPQQQDVLNFVVSGHAEVTVGGETTRVARGSIVYVPAHTPCKFHHITEDLRVMVIFSPPEG